MRTAVPLDAGEDLYHLGSGYLVADGLVLTAAHVLERTEGVSAREGQSAEVACIGGDWQPAMVAWVGAGRDVAVLSCPGLQAGSEVRWGRLAGSDPLDWGAIGLGVPRTFRTADPYRIFTGKDGIKCQGNTGNSLLSSVRRQPGWSWKRPGRSRKLPASAGLTRPRWVTGCGRTGRSMPVTSPRCSCPSGRGCGSSSGRTASSGQRTSSFQKPRRTSRRSIGERGV